MKEKPAVTNTPRNDYVANNPVVAVSDLAKDNSSTLGVRGA